MIKKTDFEDLLARIRNGDKNAETLLVQDFQRWLFTVIYSRTRDRELSQDLVQDSLLVTLISAREGKIHTAAALRGFLKTTALNIWSGHRRKAEYSRMDYDSDLIDGASKPESASLFDQVSKGQSEHYVHKILAELRSERDREVLRRVYFIGEHRQHICSALDIGPQRFDNVVWLARKRMKALIEGDKDETGGKPSDLLSLFSALTMPWAIAWSSLDHTIRSLRGFLKQAHYCSVRASNFQLADCEVHPTRAVENG